MGLHMGPRACGLSLDRTLQAERGGEPAAAALHSDAAAHGLQRKRSARLWTWLSSHGGERGQQSWGRRVVSTEVARSHPSLRLLTASLLRPPWVLGQQAAALLKASPTPPRGLPDSGTRRPEAVIDLGPENSSDFTALLPGGLANV